MRPSIAISARRACRCCGCTEDRACVSRDGPCWWVEWDLCSACARQVHRVRNRWIVAAALLAVLLLVAGLYLCGRFFEAQTMGGFLG